MKAVGAGGTPTTSFCLQSSRPPSTEHPINNSREPVGVLRALPKWCSTRAPLPQPGFLSCPSLHNSLYHLSSALSLNMPSAPLYPLSRLPSSLGRQKGLGDEAWRESLAGVKRKAIWGPGGGCRTRTAIGRWEAECEPRRSDHSGDGKQTDNRGEVRILCNLQSHQDRLLR